jgi:hypothetical protein
VAVFAAGGALVAPAAAYAGTTLVAYQAVSEPTPVTVQAFDFGTTAPYWSVVGIKPPAGADDDLVLTDAGGAALGASDRPGSRVDAVAVNSNVRPLGGYEARVNRYAGSGTFQVELAQGEDVLTAGLPPVSQPVAVHGGFLAVRDMLVRAGDVYQITISGHVAGVAGYLLAAGTSVGNLDQAAASCVATNTSCTLTYTPAGAGWAGLVLLSPDGGDLTVTASRASPSPVPQP